MSEPETSRRSTSDRTCLAGLLLAFAGLFVLLRPHGLIINDEGWYLHPALRMREGELLYRDVFVYYAPLPYHLLCALFALTRPSIIAARTVWMVLLLGSIAGSYRLARRFVPPTVAWLPAVAYGLAPGPWHKATYGFCTVMFLLMLVRALERRTHTRIVSLGVVAGITLMTRQELGLVQGVLATTLMAIAPSLETGITPATVRRGARAALLVTASLTAIVAPLVAYYATEGALADMVGAVFGQAASYSYRPPHALLRLMHPRTLASAYEGSGVGALLLVPLAFFPVALVCLVRALRACPSRPSTLVAVALVAHTVPAFVQGYNPPLLGRHLQSAIPFYLLVVWTIGSLEGRARRAAVSIAVLALILQTAGVVAGFERVHPSDAYTGSLRLLRYATPVRVLHDTVFTDEATAQEIASVRGFFEQFARPGEPVFAAPLHSLWYVLLERPNRTAFVADVGDVGMSIPRKEREMARLLASDTRYALADGEWWRIRRGPGPGRTIVTGLATAFRPVARVGSLVILERRTGASFSR